MLLVGAACRKTSHVPRLCQGSRQRHARLLHGQQTQPNSDTSENLRISNEGLAWASTHGYCSAAMSTSKSLVPLRFSLVGPGRVGCSLAHWLTARGAEIVAVAGRDPERSGSLARQLGGTPTEVDQLQTEGQALLLLAVSDPALSPVATVLAERPQAEVALHTAGALDPSVLAPLQVAGSSIGSLHPLMAFPRVLTDPGRAAEIVFALDGDPPARNLAERIVLAWDGIPVLVTAEERPIYHLGASIAAGGVVTLLATAFEMASRQGLPSEVMQGYLALARGALEQASRSDRVADAITGPVARGDMETFQRQIKSLEKLDPSLTRAVIALADLTRRFTAKESDAHAPSTERTQAPKP